MESRDLLIRCMAFRRDGAWVAICLPFDLVAQDETYDGVKEKLDAQIRDYVREAVAGPDRKHAEYLLSRRAPARYWVMYAFGLALQWMHVDREARSFKSVLPVVPVPC